MRSLLRSFCLLTALVFCGAGAVAQQTPIMGSQSEDTMPAETPAKQAYRILVIGDSLAGGLGAGLARVVEGDDSFEIANRFQEVSGIARPEVYDWSASLPKLMEDKAFNAVVVLIGSNDRQEIRRDNFRFAFNSTDWVKAYQQQTDALLAVLKNSGVKIFWLALPPMGDARYDADMQVITALQQQRVEAAGAYFIDLRKPFANPDGSYTASGTDDTGTTRTLRDSDGIGFTRAGNTKLAALMLEEIKRRIEGKTDLPLTTIADPPLIVVPEGKGPLFGGGAPDGHVAVYGPAPAAPGAAVAMAAPELTATPITPADLPRGSAAERLYVQGIADPAPAGRFDDYTLPKPAE